ncbi:caspase family protein [bacterium]|nr:caspase family protein [bacterium]MBP9809339.1 caspase family protein [bacterium]
MKKTLNLLFVSACLMVSPAATAVAPGPKPEPEQFSNSQSAVSGSASALGSVASSVTSQVAAPVADKWALIVGISKFKDEKVNLKFAAKDATDFANFLIKHENFAADHVLLLTDDKATRKNILESLGSKWLPRLAMPSDLVVLYFSTHGSPSDIDEGGVNYLIAHDTEVDNLYATGIPMQDLVRMIKGRVHSDRIVIFLDACHSGATTADGKGIVRVSNIDADEVVQGTGQLVISSSAPNERSWESKNDTNGVFTKHLISALSKDGAATTLGNAFVALKQDVQAEVLRDRAQLQTPVLRSKWQGADLALALPPTKPRQSLPFEAASDDLPVSDASVSKPATASSTSASSGTSAVFSKGVDGQWDSNWGKVTLVHGAIVGDKPVKVTGYWIQDADKNRGVFRSGSFDPKTGLLKLTYWQNWNLMLGKATFKMSTDGKRMEGSWKHFGVAGDPWIIWRP